VFVTAFAQGLDVVAAGFITLLDAALSAGNTVKDTLDNVAAAASELKKGNIDAATEAAQSALQRPGEGVSGFLDRTGRRAAGLRSRQQARKRALATGDLSLLPSAPDEGSGTSQPSSGESGGGGSDEFDSEAIAEEFADAVSSAQTPWEDKLDEILTENERTAGALEGSALVQSDSRSDISEALLDPLERAPRATDPAAAAAGGPAGGGDAGSGAGDSAAAPDDASRASGSSGTQGSPFAAPGQAGIARDDTPERGRDTTHRSVSDSPFAAPGQAGIARDDAVTVELHVDGQKLAEENDRASRKYIESTRVTE
jgi:hypothetical protein